MNEFVVDQGDKSGKVHLPANKVEGWDPIYRFISTTYFWRTPKPGLGLPTSHVTVFLMFNMWDDCSFCWCWWNCWPSLFKFLFIIRSTCRDTSFNLYKSLSFKKFTYFVPTCTLYIAFSLSNLNEYTYLDVNSTTIHRPHQGSLNLKKNCVYLLRVTNDKIIILWFSKGTSPNSYIY